jgi:hypothetical protein
MRGNRYHGVKRGYEFPSLSVVDLWNLWLHGNIAQEIAPFRHLTPCNDLQSKYLVRYSRGKSVMEAIIKTLGHSAKQIAEMAKVESDVIFQEAFVRTFPSVVDSGRRYDLLYSTMYKKLNSQE